ncbi:MAG: PH domain-containing protein [Pirellulales bacterium]|nr:PH domain-containing protein [Pirellulales bacterium]
MKCRACGTEVVDTSVFCHRCGERLNVGDGGESAAESDASRAAAWHESTSPESSPDAATACERLGGAIESARRNNQDVVEEELWRGGYCGKAMMGSWMLGLAVTIGILILAIFAGSPTLWWIVLGAIVLAWAYLVVVYARQRLGVHYRLTSQRFFHEKGILVHRTDLIEVIDMDDIAYSQTIIDRLFGVGTIRITSSDRSDPDLVIPGIANVRDVAAKLHEARHGERLRRGLHIESI